MNKIFRLKFRFYGGISEGTEESENMKRQTLILIRHGDTPPVTKSVYIGSSDVR